MLTLPDGVLEMTFHYTTQHTDLWAINIMFIIRRPLLRYTLVGLLLAMFCGASGLFYLSTEDSLSEAVGLATAGVVIGLVVFWLLGRALMTRLMLVGNPPETQEATISQRGFEVRTPMFEAKYSWSAVSEIVISRKYAYIFFFGTTPYSFARTGFASPDIASDFCNQIVSFVEPIRIVLLGKVKVSEESKVSGTDRVE